MAVRHIFWDLGGTLIDNYPSIRRALLSVLGEHHVSVTDLEMQRLLHISIAETMDVLSLRFGIDRDEFTRAYEALKDRWALQPAPVMPGAVGIMTEVRRRRGLNLVVTNRDRQSATLLMKATGLRAADMICASADMPRKPDPTMHRTLLERHELDPAECLGVGDRDIDTLAAQAVGMPAVQLASPGARVPVGVDVIGSLVEINQYLERD